MSLTTKKRIPEEERSELAKSRRSTLRISKPLSIQEEEEDHSEEGPKPSALQKLEDRNQKIAEKKEKEEEEAKK